MNDCIYMSDSVAGAILLAVGRKSAGKMSMKVFIRGLNPPALLAMMEGHADCGQRARPVVAVPCLSILAWKHRCSPQTLLPSKIL